MGFLEKWVKHNITNVNAKMFVEYQKAKAYMDWFNRPGTKEYYPHDFRNAQHIINIYESVPKDTDFLKDLI